MITNAEMYMLIETYTTVKLLEDAYPLLYDDMPMAVENESIKGFSCLIFNIINNHTKPMDLSGYDNRE